MYAAGLVLSCWAVLGCTPPASAHVAANPEILRNLGLREGEIVGSNVASDPDIFIINENGYRRLFLSPAIFSFYGHLRYDGVRKFADTVVASMPISTLFRNCETDDPKVYALDVTAEDDAALGWVNVSGQTAVAEDPDFFKRIFCINSREFAWYRKGPAYTTLAAVPVYVRTRSAGGLNETTLPLSVPDGFRISLFTPKVGPLRFMAFSPDGILFASMPSGTGLYGGTAGSDGKVFSFYDRDGNGVADEVKTSLWSLRLPHGLAFHGGYMYVAEEHEISRYTYLTGGILGARQLLATLPAGGEHKSRTIAFGPNGKMYVSVGSACNDCTTGNPGTAVIWEFNADGTGGRVFARGIRNAVGLAFNPTTGELWATENSRDFLGDDLPPDEVNIIRDSGNYGWPQCYGAGVRDPKHPQYDCTATTGSTHNLQAHSAPLGLAFVTGPQFPADWQGDLIVARHGSWNRSQPVGYDVVRLDVQGNTVVGEYPFITGWLNARGQKTGRPVDVVFGPDGGMYLSDDMANVVYKITAAQ